MTEEPIEVDGTTIVVVLACAFTFGCIAGFLAGIFVRFS